MVKNPSANARDPGLIPGPGRTPGGEIGNSLLYSCQENPLDRGAQQATAHRVTRLDTNEQLNTFYHTMNKNKLKID